MAQAFNDLDYSCSPKVTTRARSEHGCVSETVYNPAHSSCLLIGREMTVQSAELKRKSRDISKRSSLLPHQDTAGCCVCV